MDNITISLSDLKPNLYFITGIISEAGDSNNDFNVSVFINLSQILHEYIL